MLPRYPWIHYLRDIRGTTVPHSQTAFSGDISGYQTFDEVVVAVVVDETEVAVAVWAEVAALRR